MYFLFVLGGILVPIIPRSFCYKIAKFLALIRYCFAKKDKEIITYNLYPVIEDKTKIKEYTREVLINFSYYLVDFFRYPKIDRKFIKKYVRVSGLEYISQISSQGEGLIALSGHLGNYELAGVVTSLLGNPVVAVALPHKDKRINKFFDDRRNMFGMEVISTGGAIKGCFSALKQGKALALLADRDFSGGGLKVRMFSRNALVPRGPAFFALKTGVKIVPCFLIRENKKFYHMIFEKPIAYGDEVIDEESVVKKYIPVLEKYIKKYPTQWYIFEKYWLP
jgi:KDO2-lipid IV(A) lauroyltransferase